MANSFKFFLFLCAAACILAAYVTSVSADDELLFVDEPLPPFSYGEVGGHAEGGVSYQLVKEVFGRMGMDVSLKLVPWARALKMAEFGRADGLPLLLPNTERKAYMLFTGPILEGGDALVFNKKLNPGFEWKGFESLNGRTLGVVRGYTYGGGLEHKLLDNAGAVEYSEDSRANLRKLHAGRVDLVVEDLVITRTILQERENWKKDLRIHPELLTTYHWHMGISRKSALSRRMVEIESVLEEMREDGTMAGILYNEK
jgi:polar amino acid transport system substrate-binding protein